VEGRCIAQIVPKLDAGGAERSAIEIAQALVQQGHRALIIAGRGRWSGWAEDVGAELIELDLSGRNPLHLRHIWTLKRLLENAQVDLIDSRSRLPSWLVKAARALMPSPPRWVTSVHGMHSVSRYSAIQHAGEAVIAVSESTRAYVQRNYRDAPAEIEVIPRGVSLASYQIAQNTPAWRAALHAEFPALRARRMLLLPGRASRLKNHRQAIELLHALLPAHPALALFCPGAIDPSRQRYLQELMQQASALGVQDRVVLAPARSDLIAAYQEAALVLQLSSQPESFGRTVAEALAAGAPVLGFDHGGVGEQLRQYFPEGCVPLGRSELLVLQAHALLQRTERLRISGLYSLEAMQQATLAVYARLLDQR
jgi:glycosyltransferase involved in cell wall biosynthesis